MNSYKTLTETLKIEGNQILGIYQKIPELAYYRKYAKSFSTQSPIAVDS